jgi:hypothetical protein
VRSPLTLSADERESLENEDDETKDSQPRVGLAQAGGRLRDAPPLAPDREFAEIQFLVADVDDAAVLEKEIGS